MDAASAALIGAGIGVVGGFAGNAWSDSRRRRHELTLDARRAERETATRWLDERLPRYQKVIEIVGAFRIVVYNAYRPTGPSGLQDVEPAGPEVFLALEDELLVIAIAVNEAGLVAGDEVADAGTELYSAALQLFAAAHGAAIVRRQGATPEDTAVLDGVYDERYHEFINLSTQFGRVARAEIRS